MSLRPLGLIFTVASLLAPLIWLPEIAQGRDVIALFSQYLGIMALIAMAILQLIATRWPGTEALFGGLDRGYILHKWLGIGALVAILLHDTIDAEMTGLGAETLLVELAETLGEISLYGILILVVITVATFIPYHLWRWTHRVMGVFFAMGAFHYLFILKPFANSDPLGIYTGLFCLMGIVAFSYRLLPAAWRASYRYEVSEVSQTGTATALTLKPIARGLRHKPGQFAFLSLAGGEPHPYTLSSAPRTDGSLRISISATGDSKGDLAKHCRPGATARLEGAYGHFERRISQEPELWIAAGIGITPFLAWAEALAAENGPVHLFYCVRDMEAAPHLADITALAKTKANLHLHLHSSKTQGRADASQILATTGLTTAGLTVSFCGPKPMRQSLKRAFAEKGLPQKRFKFEEFEIRTGVGLKRLATLLFERAKKTI